MWYCQKLSTVHNLQRWAWIIVYTQFAKVGLSYYLYTIFNGGLELLYVHNLQRWAWVILCTQFVKVGLSYYMYTIWQGGLELLYVHKLQRWAWVILCTQFAKVGLSYYIFVKVVKNSYVCTICTQRCPWVLTIFSKVPLVIKII